MILSHCKSHGRFFVSLMPKALGPRQQARRIVRELYRASNVSCWQLRDICVLTHLLTRNSHSTLEKNNKALARNRKTVCIYKMIKLLFGAYEPLLINYQNNVLNRRLPALAALSFTSKALGSRKLLCEGSSQDLWLFCALFFLGEKPCAWCSHSSMKSNIFWGGSGSTLAVRLRVEIRCFYLQK